MARRRQESILETLSTLPWWVSVVVAGIVYVFLKWFIVPVAGANPVLKALAQMLHGIGVEPDFYLYFGSFQFRASAPGRLHSGQKHRIERRIIVVNLWVKLVHGRTSLHVSPPGAG